MTVHSVVIVGGGIAGVSTAAALRAGGFDGDVTLVDAGEFPYDRPPLSKDYLAGRVDLKSIALQLPQWYDDHRVRLISQTSVDELRTDLGAVELSDGTTLPADKVVLATGGRAARPPVDGVTNPGIHVLRTADDADRLRVALASRARILIVGAGLIGAEVASTARELGCEVVIADPVAAPLASAFSPDVATWLHGMHERHGATTVSAAIQSLDVAGGSISAELAGRDQPQVFDVVLLAVGMAPETSLAQTGGLHVGRGGIAVDAGQVTSNPAVLAVGDAAHRHIDGVPIGRGEHWEAAQQDGQRAAATILGAAPPPDTASWFWTDRYGAHVEVVGRLNDTDQLVPRGQLGQPPFSVFAVSGRHVVGAVSVDDSTAVRAARRMIDHAVEVDAAELSDPATDLRRLLRRRSVEEVK